MAWVHRMGNLPQHLLLYSSRFTTWRFVTLPGIIVPSTFHPIPPRFHFEKNNQSGNTWYENRGFFNEENSHRLSIRENSSIYRRPTRGFNYPVEYERVDRQSGVFIECTFRYVAPVTTGREKWKTVGDATRQYQEENPRRIWRNINVAWKMKSICIYTYIKSIRGAMTRGQTFVFSPFQVSFRFIFLINETNRG